LLLLPGLLTARSTTTVTLYPHSWVNVERYKDNQNAAYAFRALSKKSEQRAYVGRQDNESGFTNTFRMAYAFDLSQIPAGLQVLNVKLFMSVTLTSNSLLKYSL
jgi:hypothetical protein